MSASAEIGIIGGSGLYEMEGFTDVAEVAVETPFGPPSDKLMVGRLEGRRVAFLPRHGEELLDTCAWLAWLELWRVEGFLERVVREARAD